MMPVAKAVVFNRVVNGIRISIRVTAGFCETVGEGVRGEGGSCEDDNCEVVCCEDEDWDAEEFVFSMNSHLP